MNIKKTEISNKIKACLPGIEIGKTIIEGTDLLNFQEKQIVTYNDSISISINFESTLRGNINAIELFKIISKAPSDELEITDSNDSWEIKAGKMTANIKKIETNITKYIEKLKLEEQNWKNLPEKFMDAMSLCKISCSNSPYRGIFVSSQVMASTDLSRINYHNLLNPMDQFWIDDTGVTELLKIKTFQQYSVDNNWVHFKKMDGTVFSCKRKDDTAFPFDKVVNVISGIEKNKEDMEFEFPENTAVSVDRVSIMASNEDGTIPIKITLKDKGLEIFSEKHSGNISEMIDWKTVRTDILKPVEFWIDSTFLQQACRKSLKFYTKNIKEGQISIIFYGENYKQLIATVVKN